MTKFIIAYFLIFIAGIIFSALCHKFKEPNKPIKAGVISIRKNEEAIDGQILLAKSLWDISSCEEVVFKVKILSGEPGDWEDENNG